jgi:hypothetical protein
MRTTETWWTLAKTVSVLVETLSSVETHQTGAALFLLAKLTRERNGTITVA